MTTFAGNIDITTLDPLFMSKLKILLPRLILLTLILSLTGITSCDWEKIDQSPEPDHPLYVTYTITASSLEFVGPEQLLLDIQTWIKTNQIAYDKQVNYKSGEASEFAKTDTEAAKKFDEFLPKFKNHLETEVKKQLKEGVYGELETDVSAIFAVYAARTQGQGGNLKYEQVKFTYP